MAVLYLARTNGFEGSDLQLDPELLAQRDVARFDGPRDALSGFLGRSLEQATDGMPEAEMLVFADRYMKEVTRLCFPQPTGKTERIAEAEAFLATAEARLAEIEERSQRRKKILHPILMMMVILVLYFLFRAKG